MSLPLVLSVEGDRLIARQHAALAACLDHVIEVDFTSSTSGMTVVGPVSTAWRLTVVHTAIGASSLSVSVTGQADSLIIRLDSTLLRITDGAGIECLRMSTESTGAEPEPTLDCVADADILEPLTTTAGVAAVRVP